MTRSLEVEIDETGNIHPIDGTVKLPAGRAMLVWDSAGHELYLMSERSLAEDWLSAEEDAAWAHLQQAGDLVQIAVANSGKARIEDL